LGYLDGVTWGSVWSVLKWVLAALAAGFVGQFGRSFALRLIERRRRRSSEEYPAQPSVPIDAELERERLAAQAKIEKKRAKAEVKRAKKGETTDS